MRIQSTFFIIIYFTAFSNVTPHNKYSQYYQLQYQMIKKSLLSCYGYITGLGQEAPNKSLIALKTNVQIHIQR